MRLQLALFATFVTFVTSVSAQPTPQQPKFDTRADLVLVDVTVVDDDGKPIQGLNPEDFELIVNGKPRPIHTVQFISTVGLTSTAEPAPREEHFSTNDGPSSGRLLLFAVDENHVRVGASMGVIRTVDMMMNSMASGDLVGLARLPYGTGGVEPTTDRTRIRRALQTVTGKQPQKSLHTLRIHEAWAFESGNTNLWARVLERECGASAMTFAGAPGGVPGVGGGAAGGSTDSMGTLACVRQIEAEAKGTIADFSTRGSQSIRALEQLMASMKAFRMPVTVILISEGLFIARDRNDLTNFARHASDARVTLHVVHPGQSMFDHDKPEVIGAGFGDDPLLGEGLEMLAGYTRGTYNRIAQGTGRGTFDRLSRELTGYYLLSFEPNETDRTSRSRWIKVDVKRRGVTVRARSTYSLPDVTPVAAVTPEEEVKQLLTAPLPTPGLPIRVATYAVPNTQDSRLRVILSAEIGEDATDEAQWPVGVLVLDKDNNFVVNTIAPMTLAPASSRVQSPRLLLTALLLDPGVYSLRLAAVAPDGRSGSVHHTIRASLSPLGGREDVRASDLMLSPPPGPSGMPRPTPSAIIDTDTLSAALDLAGDSQRLAGARVTLEVATDEAGAALLKADAPSGSRAGPQRSFGASLKVGLLPPGEYVVRAIVSIPGAPDALITRPFKLDTRMGATSIATDSPRPDADADATPLGSPRSPIVMPLPRFTPEDVLKPAIVRAFIEDLKKRFPLSKEATAILDYASKGVFGAPPADLRTTASDEPALAFVRGLDALQKKQPAQAAAWFQITLRAASDYLGAAFYLGATHALSGRDKDAVGAWQMSLLSDASNVVYPIVVDGWLRAGDGQAAIDLIAEAPNAWPDDESRWKRVAMAQAMLGQYEPALEMAGRVLQRHPDDADMLLVAIQVLYRQHAAAPLTGDAVQRFSDYTTRYEKVQGPQLALVQAWRKAVLR